MNKLVITAAAALFAGASAFAQTEPNRLMLNLPGEPNYKSFVLDRMESLSFARVEGPVKAEIEVLEVLKDRVVLDVFRTADCESFYINVFPKNTVSQLKDPVNMFRYLQQMKSPQYAEDFEGGALSGFDFTPGGDYCVVTGAMDRYGTEVDVCVADFKAYQDPVVGNPQVTAELVSSSLYGFTVKFTPNSDVSAYYCVAGEKGQMEKQYEQFGPMFGVSRIDDLIKKWGVKETVATTKEWKDEAPNSEYEIYIAIEDKKGNFAPLNIFTVSTGKLGGEGTASVTVTPGKYELADWDGQKLPSQFFRFTPNDQSAAYRFSVYKKDIYDADKEEIKKELCSDPEMPMAYWFFYEEIETDYQIDPKSTVVAVAAAKNIKGEWGPVTEYEYTTPAQVQGMAPADRAPRLLPVAVPVEKGRVPALASGRRLTLSH